jgi:hypothetical protein
MRARVRWLILSLLLLGCSDVVSPSRTPRYFFDSAGDVFHWPADRLPVRYWVDPRGGLPARAARGLAVWQEQFLYGEFTATTVSDSSVADVLVSWQDSVPPDVAPDTAGAVGACDGVTTYLIDSTKAITAPLHVHISVNLGFTQAQVAACVRRVVDHELGHSLGILSHSSDPSDLMYVTPGTEIPTARDRNTAQVLYHTTPTLKPPPPR